MMIIIITVIIIINLIILVTESTNINLADCIKICVENIAFVKKA